MTGLAFILGVLVAGLIFGQLYDRWFERTHDHADDHAAAQVVPTGRATVEGADGRCAQGTAEALEASPGEGAAAQGGPQGQPALYEAVTMQARTLGAPAPQTTGAPAATGDDDSVAQDTVAPPVTEAEATEPEADTEPPEDAPEGEAQWE